MTKLYVVLGAGVIGLTTALELRERYPEADITVVAKFLPGDRSSEYASPWAGANWYSFARDNGRQEDWDRITYLRFKDLARTAPETGIKAMEVQAIFDKPIEEADILTAATGKIWYDSLCGGIRFLPKEQLPPGSCFGCNFDTFVIDVQMYLPWLQSRALGKNIQIHRGVFSNIRQLFEDYPKANAYFNCTGLGSFSLGGVEDKDMYPTRGQVVLVQNPTKTPMTRMYLRSPRRSDADTTYIFPRGLHGGVILGGCRIDGDWNGEVDLEFAENIKRRCCALAPELGKPQDLKVISNGVGLRPSRKGGARIERQMVGDALLIHNYGAGGGGYQSSWGSAKHAVDLLNNDSRL